jgi:hypothetical protein
MKGKDGCSVDVWCIVVTVNAAQIKTSFLKWSKGKKDGYGT